MKSWVLVDDSQEESAVLAALLSQEGILKVEVISASRAQEQLEKLSLTPDGILMDVDLSNEAGLRFTWARSGSKHSGGSKTRDVAVDSGGKVCRPGKDTRKHR